MKIVMSVLDEHDSAVRDTEPSLGTHAAILTAMQLDLKCLFRGPVEPTTIAVFCDSELGRVSAPPAVRACHLGPVRAPAAVLPGSTIVATLDLKESYSAFTDAEGVAAALSTAVRHVTTTASTVDTQGSRQIAIEPFAAYPPGTKRLEIRIAVPASIDPAAACEVNLGGLDLYSESLLREGAIRARIGVNHDARPAGVVYAAARDGKTAEMMAALAAGGSTGEALDGGWTCLHIAAVNDHGDVVAALAALGAPLNALGGTGHQYFGADAPGRTTPLAAALRRRRRGDLGAVRALLAAPGLDVNAPNAAGYPPLIDLLQSSRSGEADALHLLLAAPGLDANVRGDNGKTALVTLVTGQRQPPDPRVLAALLAVPGIDVNARDATTCGRAALHYVAVCDSEPGLAAALLAAPGADPNVRDAFGMTPLHLAIQHGSSGGAIAAVLLASPRLDPNVRDARGQTALHYAVAGSPASVSALIAVPGVDVNARDFAGQTPLHVAAMLGAADCAALLVGHGGAALEAVDAEGLSPLALAQDRKQHAVASLLLAAAGGDTSRSRELPALGACRASGPGGHGDSGDAARASEYPRRMVTAPHRTPELAQCSVQ